MSRVTNNRLAVWYQPNRFSTKHLFLVTCLTRNLFSPSTLVSHLKPFTVSNNHYVSINSNDNNSDNAIYSRNRNSNTRRTDVCSGGPRGVVQYFVRYEEEYNMSYSQDTVGTNGWSNCWYAPAEFCWNTGIPDLSPAARLYCIIPGKAWKTLCRRFCFYATGNSNIKSCRHIMIVTYRKIFYRVS